jgi:calcineurin-like phosphoesterase family protein
VPNNGICYFLGDMGLCKSEELGKVIAQLNGTKVLVLGNHDKNSHAMYNLGFDVVLNSAIIYLGDKRISMSHCPLPGIKREDMERGLKPGENWHGEFKNQRFTSQDLTVDFHLHGHVHKQKNEDYKTDRQYDVGVAANNYTPVSLSTIESWIAKELKK